MVTLPLRTASLGGAIAALTLMTLLGACSSAGRAEAPSTVTNPDTAAEDDGMGFMGLGLFGTGTKRSAEVAATGPGVNSYLWRASLDTLSFMPLVSADPIGGVIITDWLANPQVPNERFKMTVYILDQNLRSDGVKVSVFRQVKSGGDWADSTVNPATATQLENAILTRARQLRVDATSQ